jgi:hypothetical protein
VGEDVLGRASNRLNSEQFEASLLRPLKRPIYIIKER